MKYSDVGKCGITTGVKKIYNALKALDIHTTTSHSNNQQTEMRSKAQSESHNKSKSKRVVTATSSQIVSKKQRTIDSMFAVTKK
jgi:hypothetical protein